MTTTYPSAVDAINRPTPTTLRNAPGYNLSKIVDDLADAVEAAQAKLGTGVANQAPGASAAVLRRTGAAASAWGQVVGADITPLTITDGLIAAGTINGDAKLVPGSVTGNGAGSAIGAGAVHGNRIQSGSLTAAQIGAAEINATALQYTLPSDVTLALAAGTWTALTPTLSMVFTDGTAPVEIFVRGACNIVPTAATGTVGARVLIQNATPYHVGGGLAVVGQYINAFGGSSCILMPAPGGPATWQISVQLYCAVAATAYCRPSNYPNIEGCVVLVRERKR